MKRFCCVQATRSISANFLRAASIAGRCCTAQDIYNSYAESILGAEHLCRIRNEAQTVVTQALTEPLRTTGKAASEPWPLHRPDRWHVTLSSNASLYSSIA